MILYLGIRQGKWILGMPGVKFKRNERNELSFHGLIFILLNSNPNPNSNANALDFFFFWPALESHLSLNEKIDD